jgi:hypothetical protein
MSYAASAALQTAVFEALQADAALAGLIGTALYDAVPEGTLPPLYALLGDEEVRDASDGSGGGAAHRFTVSVVTTQPGFQAAKAAAGRICALLQDMVPVLPAGRVVSLRFERARARRIDKLSGRRIDLRFRARIENG